VHDYSLSNRARRHPALATDRGIKLQICKDFKMTSGSTSPSGSRARPARATPGRKPRRTHARGIERREAIVDAAVRLFARHGFRGTGILGLAKEVGISHVGILHHFGTKEGLLMAVVERRDRQQASRIEHLRELRGLEALRALKSLGEEDLVDELHTRLFVVLVSENLHPEDPLNAYFRARARDIRRFVADNVRAGQADGEIRPDADADAVAAEVVGFIAGISVQSVLHPAAVDVAAGYRRYLERVIDDLRAGPG
jgi:AcrR family transcriptional regulator